MKKGNVILDIGNGNCVFNGREWVVTTNDAPVSDPRLIVMYNVADASNSTKLFNYDSSSRTAALLFDKVEVDGVEVSISDLDTAQGRYQLSVGEHTVAYTLKDQTTIGDGAFNRCSSLTSITIPNSVTSIGSGAFEECSGLTSVTIGSGVTSIDTGAFRDCTALTSITIPDSVTSIGLQAFYQCNGLTSVTIGSGITGVGDYAFQGCSSLTNITSHIMSAPSVNGGTFYNVSNGGTLYVPIGSSGYETWMDNQGNLGMYNWTKVEQ